MQPDIVEFATDPALLGLSLSPAQETLLRATYGLPLDAEQTALFRDATGRTEYLARPFGEVTCLAGARAGKDSRIAAPVVCYEAVFGGHEARLAKGERGVIVLVAQDARATKVAFGYVSDYFTQSPLLSGSLAEPPLASEVRLTNGLTVACFPSTLRSLRGWSIPAGVLDELAFFRLEGQADSDAEIQASVRRGMLAFPAARLVKISTPYMRSGVCYDDFKKAWAQPDPDLLVWKAPSVLMNPSLLAERLDRERRLDPARFAREYEAEFAEDLDAFLPSAWVDAAVTAGRHELPPQEGVRYAAGVDPSGGGADAFTLAVAHAEGQGAERRVVQDVMKGWRRTGTAQVDLAGIVAEIAAICRRYRVTAVGGDRYSAGWVRQEFQRQSIRYEEAPDKSHVYLECEPLFAQGQIDVLAHPVLVRELRILERRPRPGGRTLVDHPTGAHDDHANALALAAVRVAHPSRTILDDIHTPSITGSPSRAGGEVRCPCGATTARPPFYCSACRETVMPPPPPPVPPRSPDDERLWHSV